MNNNSPNFLPKIDPLPLLEDVIMPLCNHKMLVLRNEENRKNSDVSCFGYFLISFLRS